MRTTGTGTTRPAGGETIGSGGAAAAAHHWNLPPDLRAVARARDLTRRSLRTWHVTGPADVDDIVLIVDELVTNAVVHGAGTVHLALRLDAAGGGVRLTGEVGDADPRAPGAP
ncbi:hypothetical protein GWI34_35695, partial [Actinomadura sp. DSM 109109]|nr:hypothetical protein [Actinomadura lepetitiana]